MKMTKFGNCKLCVYLTAIGLTASCAVLIASNYLNLEFAKVSALLTTAFFAVWGLLHLIGYASKKDVKEGVKRATQNYSQ